MNDQDEDFKGKKIPKKYWDKLVEWRADAPYDGCFYKYSHACVDTEGNFRLIDSEGRDYNDWMEVVKSPHGLVLGYKSLCDHSPGWCDREMQRIKEKHGFMSVEPPSVVFNRHCYETVEKVFGKKWYEIPSEERHTDPRVTEAVRPMRERLEAYDRDMTDFMRRRQERLNALFCGALYDQKPEDWKLYPLDGKHIRHTCEDFCRNYGSTVGVMCGVLDALQEFGYEPWCTCSDCGKQFQLSDYEKFSDLVDDNAYHGDGGIGCIYTRVLCEDCMERTKCPQCGDPDLPNPNDPSVEGHEYDHTSYRERFIMKWLGVCQNCADSFFYKDEYKHWDEDIDDLESKIDAGMAQLDKYLEIMREEGGMSDADLERPKAENLKGMSRDWRELTNALREKMSEDVKEFFDEANDWVDNRIDEGEKYDYD